MPYPSNISVKTTLATTIRTAWRMIRHWRRVLIGQEVPVRVNLNMPAVSIGARQGGWRICTQTLCRQSVVYSFGIGEDISFERELIERFGMTVHAFDPTPRSLAWLSSQSLPPQLIAHPLGLAAHDGIMCFSAPHDPAHVSFSALRSGPGDPIELTVNRLSTIMNSLGHARIDLLKLDIEGSEYAVLDDLLDNRTPVRQILVEFHHRFPAIGRRATRHTLRRLRRADYRLFSISESYEEYGFIHSATFGQS